MEEARKKLSSLLNDLKESIQDLKAEDFLPPNIWLPRKKSFFLDDDKDCARKDTLKPETKFVKNKLSNLVSFDDFKNWDIDPNEVGAYLDFSENDDSNDSHENSDSNDSNEKDEKENPLENEDLHFYIVNNNFGSDDLSSELRTILKVHEKYVPLLSHIDSLREVFSFSDVSKKFKDVPQKDLNKIFNVLVHVGYLNFN